MSLVELKKRVTLYTQNIIEQQNLNALLFKKLEKEEWLAVFGRRAKRLEEIFEQNCEILKYIESELAEPLTKERAEALENIVSSTYPNVDNTLICLFKERLLDYFEKENNISCMLRLYRWELFYTKMDIASGRIESRAVPLQKKAMALGADYANLTRADRKIIFFCYMNYASAMPAYGYVSLDDSYRAWDELLRIWNSEEVQRLDGNDEEFLNGYNYFRKAVFFNDENIEQASAKTRKRFCDEIEKIFAEERAEKGRARHNWDYRIYRAWLHGRVLQGLMTWHEAVDKLFAYYKEWISARNYERIGVETKFLDESSVFFLNAPVDLVMWMSKDSGRSAKKRNAEIIRQLMTDITSIIYDHLYDPFNRTEINYMLTRMCFSMLPYLQTRKEKEDFLLHLVIRRQFATYVHCAMVQKLTDTIFDAFFAARPELFSDVLQIIPEEELPQFVSKCGLFHDIGKTRITDIINMQIRPLDDYEFDAIRRHPKLGFDAVIEDCDFVRYRDIILFHHKFYNGQGGYPAEFDNTGSPYRIIIDLITICDCLDAATDNLGRNYKRAKTLEQVLTEFERDKGVRYNPDIVDFIAASPELQDKLKRLIADLRAEIAYEVYCDVAWKGRSAQDPGGAGDTVVSDEEISRGEILPRVYVAEADENGWSEMQE